MRPPHITKIATANVNLPTPNRAFDIMIKNLERNLSLYPISWVLEFLNDNHIEYVIFGGFIRDTYLDKVPKDLDICVNCSGVDLRMFIDRMRNAWMSGDRLSGSHFRTKPTNLGGYSLHVDGYDFDIWSICGMKIWENFPEPRKLENLHKTASCSCNMITYNPQTSELLYPENYFDLLDDKKVLINWDNVLSETFNKRYVQHRRNYMLQKIGAVEGVRKCMHKPYFGYEEKQLEGFCFYILKKGKRISFHRDNDIYCLT